MRYAREFAALQKNLGIQLIDKQNRARDKQNELLAAKQKMSELVQEVIRQRKQLAAEHSVVKANVAQLQKKQKEIEKQVAEQQKQLNALTKKIDELVAYELEQARKRAEAEARRKREAELAKAKKNAKSNTKDKGGKGTAAGKKTPPPAKWLTAEDVVNNVKRYARNGSIITFHDSLKSIDKLRTALPQSIQWLKDQGYQFKVFE
jgi:septal ring factor EnvC (AmiA/AmiB activator)